MYVYDTDHIHVVNQLKEKRREYNSPLCIAFVDNEKAFDSVQTQAVLTSFSRTGERRFVHRTPKGILYQQLYNSRPIQRKQQDQHQERQGDTISHNLFRAALESIFSRLTWDTRGLTIDSEYLSYLRFADDVVICANTPLKLQQMLHELADESENQGLKMNKYKTNVMMENDTTIYYNNLQTRTLKATSTWETDTAPERETKTNRFKEEHSRIGSIHQAPGHLQG